MAEQVTDEQLVNLIEAGVQNSVGDWLNSSDLTRERLRSTYEFAGVPEFHLAPNGVSSIVDTSTTETVEAYTAILSDLFLSNNKLANFIPVDDSPMEFTNAKNASDMVNYCIFKKNKGWEEIQTWIKSALLWKNGIIRWEYVEDFDYTFQNYKTISEEKLYEILAEEGMELVGELVQDNSEGGIMYKDVRIKKTIDKSRVKIMNIAPESFRISRDATSIDDASFVGTQADMTRSEIRKWWPDVADHIEDWNKLGNDDKWLGNARYSEDIAARKFVTGQEYWQGSVSQDLFPLEANRKVTVTECWIHVDRDGDGIAELKHFILAGDTILYEEDVDMIPLAALVPIDIPFEFYGLSIADFTRSSTLASTAVLRGFVENTYLTNYSPKLADPNMVDFSALQNLKPKQIVPTNGNPAAAVQPLPPENLSSGTVPLLEYLQVIKEQATGMSKAAQGLNDTLYVSGNSEQKLQAVQSASQKRIQHIARRFAETGFKRLCMGIYTVMKQNMSKISYSNESGVFQKIDMDMLPNEMEVEVMLDIGENSNSSRLQKLATIGNEIIPTLSQAGMGNAVKPETPAIIAAKAIDALGMNPGDFLADYTTDEFKAQMEQSQQQAAQVSQAEADLNNRKMEADAQLAEANVRFTDTQAANAVQDNIRQMTTALDSHYQKWADLKIKAEKEGTEMPPAPDVTQLFQLAVQAVAMAGTQIQTPQNQEVTQEGTPPVE